MSIVKKAPGLMTPEVADPNYYAHHTVAKAQAALDTTASQKRNEKRAIYEPIRAVPEH